MKLNCYCHAKIPRSGLGNCMLVWARAFIATEQYGCELLAPQWSRLRLGPIKRREPVTRFYAGEFTNRNYVAGLRRLMILLLNRRVSESVLHEDNGLDLSSGIRVHVIEFEGLRDYFASLIPYQQTIVKELKRIAHPLALTRAAVLPSPFIAVNVRRGDLTRQRIPVTRIVQYTPTQWFVSAIQALRSDSRWKHIPIKVISDGSADELKEILVLPNCDLVTTGKAIGDILLMARSSLLLASGYSTFSMWASFLGQMHTLYHPGKIQQKLFAPQVRAFEGEWQVGDALPTPLSVFE